MRRGTALIGIAAAALLSGCVTTRSHAPAPHTATLPEPQTAPLPEIPRAEPASPALTMRAPGRSFWDKLRSRLRMRDCAADPRIHAWAQRYARWPHHLQAQLKSALPVIEYVERISVDYDVPAEFVFLPWVESHYRSIAPRHGRAAGMWQIMPDTARTLKLPVTAEYDGRLDKVSATDAVMRMLKRYHSTFHDWRLVDMAFNAGKYGVLHATDGHAVPDTPGIPDVRVSRGTRLHLAKLMAMACIVRHPKRYGVTLPRPNPSRKLQEVVVGTPLNMSHVAHLSSLPLRRVRALNAAYLYGRMPNNAPHHVLLPAAGAAAFSSTFAATGDTLKHANTPSHPPPPSRYTVSAGDSLWSIAQHFGTTVHHLKRWNHLQSASLHPGQTLRLGPAYQ